MKARQTPLYRTHYQRHRDKFRTVLPDLDMPHPVFGRSQEHDIAEYAKRVIELRDGALKRDEPINNRRMAAENVG